MTRSKKELVEQFVIKNTVPKYILGRTTFGEKAHALSKSSGVAIAAYIDEFNDVREFDGLPVVNKLADLPSNAIVLIGVVHGRPYSVQQRLESLGILSIDYFSLIRFGGIGLTIPYWEGFHESYQQNRESYNRLYYRFADEVSKQIFSKLLDFRLNYNLEAMKGFTLSIDNEYFESFLQLRETGEVFCDVGGFDGGTTKEFIKRCPQYERIYYFEPEPDQMTESKKALAQYARIEYCQCAAYDKKDTLRFCSDGSASMVSERGTLEIRAERIDDMVHTPVTFIKMDIEGSESLAIQGAKETILKYHPRLAICVYHKGTDYIEIPKRVLEIRDDYDVFLRHYTEGINETVMFFMPQYK